MRQCGECMVCCTYLKVPGVPKAGLCHCPHSSFDEPTKDGILFYTGKGCASYDSRPEACSGYRCAWLRGLGNEEDRPDRCGILIDQVKPIHNCLQAKPLWEGAQDDPKAIAAVERMSRQANVPVLVAGFPETHMIRVVGRGV
jgi:hypothetical protein